MDLLDLLQKEEIIDTKEDDIAVVVESIKDAGKCLHMMEGLTKEVGGVNTIKTLKTQYNETMKALNEALFDSKNSTKTVPIKEIQIAGQALRFSESYIKRAKEENTKRVVEGLSSELGIPGDQINKLYPNMLKTPDEVREHFKTIAESLGVNKFKVAGSTKITEGKENKGTNKFLENLEASPSDKLMAKYSVKK